MKTIKRIMILSAFLGLQFMAAEVNGNDFPVSVLSPGTPVVADFRDEAPASEINIITLAPVTPREADFEDDPSICNPEPLNKLAPVAPADADFEDQV